MRAMLVPAVVVALVATACGGEDDASTTPEPSTHRQSIAVTSTSFDDGGAIPIGFSCDKGNVSPPLAWDGVPGGAQSLALVVADPDAPGGTFYHWVVVDIPVGTDQVGTGKSPEGGVVTDNSEGDPAYKGPCPPSGTHHYRFTVYALSKPTGLPAGSEVASTIDAIATRAIASGSLVGTYSRD